MNVDMNVPVAAPPVKLNAIRWGELDIHARRVCWRYRIFTDGQV